MSREELQQKSRFAMIGTLMTIVSLVFLFYVGSSLVNTTKKYKEQAIEIACVDGLKGFPDAIQSVFSDTIVQLCIFHQIRNSVKYVGSKHQKEFMRDLKHVYGAVNKESAATGLLNLEEKWGEKYPIVIKS